MTRVKNYINDRRIEMKQCSSPASISNDDHESDNKCFISRNMEFHPYLH